MNLKSRIEAVLFVTGKAVSIKEIAQILETEESETEEAMLDLIMDYSSREGALEIGDENGYILQLKEDFSDIMNKLCPVELSAAILKTLTVIALKEPIRQAVLKDMRGANAYEHVGELVKQGFISRTRDKNGRSFILKTTPKFAQYFQLKGDTGALAKLLETDEELKKQIRSSEKSGNSDSSVDTSDDFSDSEDAGSKIAESLE
ncbi:MAG: SMC-Scp complex subunit ScpB [Candidatus Gastranaerophilaceae bacterium]